MPIVAAGYDAMQQTGDMEAPFIQESNFWWLTGIEEPGWRVIIDCNRAKVTLVRPQLSAVEKVFNGSLTDVEALAISGADSVINESDFAASLTQMARAHPLVMTIENKHEGMHVNPAQGKVAALLGRTFTSVEPCNKQLAELRAIKQPGEIVRIKKAIKVTTDSFKEVRANWAKYTKEYEVEAAFTYSFKNLGYDHAYAPIVAAGANACTLHYVRNSAKISPKNSVVIDIGARTLGYAADITRTYCQAPTVRQRQVHTALEQAQKQIIKLLGPNVLVSDYINQSDEIMKQAIASLGLDTDRYRDYFPHAVSHGLGVDVHDSLGGPRYFMPGMVLTVEPGIYIEHESTGMRLEDNILITDTGAQNLSISLSTDL